MDPSLDHPGGIDAWLSTHCKIQPELLPLPGSDQLLHHLNATEEGAFDLLELLSDDFHIGPGAQQADVSLPPGAQTLPNGLINCLPGSNPNLVKCNDTKDAAAHIHRAGPEHKHAAGLTVKEPEALVGGSAVQTQQQPCHSHLYNYQQRHGQQLSRHSQEQQAVDPETLAVDQQIFDHQIPANGQVLQHTQLDGFGGHLRRSLDSSTPFSLSRQQALGSNVAAEGGPQLAMATSGLSSFSTYNNAAELAAAAQAQINAAADQHAVAAQVSLTNAVNAAAAQLRSGGPSAATAQLQQELQRQQSKPDLLLGKAPSCSTLPTPAGQSLLQMMRASSATAQAGTLAPLSLSVPHPFAASLSPAAAAGVGTPHQYPTSSSSAAAAAGLPTAPFLGASAASTASLPPAAATLPAANAGLSSAASWSSAAAAAASPGVMSAAAGGGMSGFQGVMLTPAGASTGVPMGSNLMAWVQGLQKVAHKHKAQEQKFKQRRKDKVSAQGSTTLYVSMLWCVMSCSHLVVVITLLLGHKG